MTHNSDSRLVIEFIGSNADTIMPRMSASKPNIWAIFFGSAYYAYRKMYIQAIVLTVLFTILPIPSILIWVLYSFMFYPLYNSHIQKSINSIKEKNKGCSSEELTNLVRAKGGTSILAPIILLLATVIAIVLLQGVLKIALL